ncbi:MAG: tetratricopeptide repeat protein, partial [Acidimicrobiia bacterium]|nr:tetratricopeptide repeat protein [Acidimicrobiia bacterium]
GNPGMGKTRIVVEAVSQADLPLREIHINCERYESATPFHAAGQMLRSVLELKDQDPDATGAALVERLAADAPGQLKWAPLIADVVNGHVPATPEVDSLAEDFRQSTLHSAATDVMAALINGSAALVIEDSHWADESSRLLFAHLAEHAASHPWAILALRSAGEGSPLVDEVMELEIGPLDQDAAVQLVTAVAGAATPLPFAEEIARRAGGNPFYIVELAAAAHSFDAEELPESIEAVTLARIDKLRQGDRRLLRYASVFGETFAINLLADALPDVAPNVDDPAMWARLDEFLDTSSIGKVRFRQMLVRDVAYAGLPFKRRAEVHLAIAEALERRGRRRPERFAEAMSLHFDRAEDWERSWTYSRIAGDRAVKKMAHAEAMRIYTRGLRASEHVNADPIEVARIREAVGDAAEHLGMTAEADTAYDQCLADDPEVVAQSRLLRKKAMLQVSTGDTELGRQLLDDALGRLEQAEDADAAEDKLETMIAIAGLHFREGDYTSTVDWCTRAAEVAGNDHPRELAHALYMRSAAYSHLPGMDGLEDGSKALAVFEELNDLVGQTNVLNNMGYDAYYRGAWDEAVDLWSRSIETGTQSGDIVRTASSIHNLGEIFLDQGHYADVEDRLNRALRIWQGAGFAIGVGIARANLARFFTRIGRLDVAGELLDTARDDFVDAGAEAYV